MPEHFHKLLEILDFANIKQKILSHPKNTLSERKLDDRNEVIGQLVAHAVEQISETMTHMFVNI